MAGGGGDGQAQGDSGDGGSDEPPSDADDGWLPPGFQFLSGLATNEARRRRRIVAIQAFVDDSGSKGQGTYFFLAAVLADAARWETFSRRWATCLATSPRIDYFKTDEAVRLRGQFTNWRSAVRDEKLRALIQVVNGFYFRVVPFGVEVNAFEETLGPASDKPLSHPYFWAYHLLIRSVADDLFERGHRDRFEIVFDEHVILGPRARAWYPVTRAIIEWGAPEIAGIMPIDPMFRDDKEFMPLQLADLCAWLTRRHVSYDTNPIDWIRQELHSVEMSAHAHVLSPDGMRAIVRNNEPLPEELQRRLDDLSG
jgi:hypothetical protein